MITIIAVMFHFILIAGVMIADVSPAGVIIGDESAQTFPPPPPLLQDGVIIGD